MEKIKVGIIGAGRIGQVHARSLTYHIPQAELMFMHRPRKSLQPNSAYRTVMTIIMKF